MQPTGVNDVAPLTRMAIAAGNVRSWPRPMLLFWGLRENPARNTSESLARYAMPTRGVKRSFWTFTPHDESLLPRPQISS
jgi:hypothetical protein